MLPQHMALEHENIMSIDKVDIFVMKGIETES